MSSQTSSPDTHPQARAALPIQAATLLQHSRHQHQARTKTASLRIGQHEKQESKDTSRKRVEALGGFGGEVPWGVVCGIGAADSGGGGDEVGIELTTSILISHLLSHHDNHDNHDNKPKTTSFKTTSITEPTTPPSTYILHTISPLQTRAFAPETLLSELLPCLQAEERDQERDPDHATTTAASSSAFESAVKLLETVQIIKVLDVEGFDDAIGEIERAVVEAEADGRSVSGGRRPVDARTDLTHRGVGRGLRLDRKTGVVPSSQGDEDEDEDEMEDEESEDDVDAGRGGGEHEENDDDISADSIAQSQQQQGLLIIISGLDEEISRIARRGGVTIALSRLHPLQRSMRRLVDRSHIATTTVSSSPIPTTTLLPQLPSSIPPYQSTFLQKRRTPISVQDDAQRRLYTALAAQTLRQWQRKNFYPQNTRDTLLSEAWWFGLDFEMRGGEWFEMEDEQQDLGRLIEVWKYRYGGDEGRWGLEWDWKMM